MATPEAEETVAPTPTAESVVAEAVKSVHGEKEAAKAEEPATDANAVEKDLSATQVEPSLPSFKEETYFVTELKESEKKALQEFKEKIEAAIKANEFAVPPKPEVKAETEPVTAVEGAEQSAKCVAEPSGEVADSADAAVTEPAAPASELEAVPAAAPGAVAETPAVAEPTPVVDAVTPAPEADVSVVTPETETKEAVPTETETKEAVSAETEVSKETVVEEQDESIPEDVALWGVPLLHTKGDERTDVILLKFLRARDFKVNEAFSMLKNTIIWRKTFKTNSLLDEDFGSELDGVAYNCGVDKEGHPVCYNVYDAFQDKELYQKTFGDAANINRFLRWRVQVLEKGIQQLNFSPGGVSAMVQITDLKNFPFFSPTKKELRIATNEALVLLQDNYPELVVKKVFINVPWYFSALYAFYSPFVTQRTKSKFVVARTGQVPQSLFKFISPEYVPVQYGGLSGPNDTEYGGSYATTTEFVIKAGGKETIEIPIDAAGTAAVWDLAVIGWDIGYGVEFATSSAASFDIIVEKTKKIVTSEEPIHNTFKSQEAGKLVITIDNTATRKKKLAVYRYKVKAPGVVDELAG